MRTRSSNLMASALAALDERPRCRESDSPSCAPMVMTGLRLLIGSWKIIAMSRPRSFSISVSGRSSRSRPARRMRPETRAKGGSRRMIESAVMLLPEPDSPTRASVSRAAMLKLISFSTASQRPSAGSSVVRPATSRTLKHQLRGRH